MSVDFGRQQLRPCFGSRSPARTASEIATALAPVMRLVAQVANNRPVPGPGDRSSRVLNLSTRVEHHLLSGPQSLKANGGGGSSGAIMAPTDGITAYYAPFSAAAWRRGVALSERLARSIAVVLTLSYPISMGATDSVAPIEIRYHNVLHGGVLGYCLQTDLVWVFSQPMVHSIAILLSRWIALPQLWMGFSSALSFS